MCSKLQHVDHIQYRLNLYWLSYMCLDLGVHKGTAAAGGVFLWSTVSHRFLFSGLSSGGCELSLLALAFTSLDSRADLLLSRQGVA